MLHAQSGSNVTDKSFAAGGKVSMQLESGNYTVRAAADNHIRVTLGSNVGNSKVEVHTTGTQANVAVKDTPHNNFQATIEVPKTSDVTIRLTAGNLTMEAITGNKDIESTAGNVEIAVGDPKDYASVDASNKAGDINASAFGGSKSGLFPHFTWSGSGKYTIRASLGAGNLTLRK
jgi:hypothetical protein